jgi:hypothetical protein
LLQFLSVVKHKPEIIRSIGVVTCGDQYEVGVLKSDRAMKAECPAMVAALVASL